MEVKKIEFKVLPMNLHEYENKFPKAMQYLRHKCPTSISINGAMVQLNDSRSGLSCTYEHDDIEIFEKYFETQEINKCPA